MCSPVMLGLEKPWKKWPESVFVWFRNVAVELGAVEEEEEDLVAEVDGVVADGVDVGAVVELDTELDSLRMLESRLRSRKY